jgi:hypothetical protein
LANGGYSPVTSVFEAEYSTPQPVYNIDVEGGLIYADGYLAGEFGTQNDLDRFSTADPFQTYGAVLPAREEEKPFSAEAQAAIKDFKALCAERFGVNM